MSTETPTVGDTASDAPSTSAVAQTLGVNPTRLRRFVEYHPDPTPAAILGMAVANPEHHDLVEAWLEAFTARRERRREQHRQELGMGD